MNTINSTAQVFKDFQINVKLKISALWIAIMFCYVYGDYIEIYVPGVIANAMTVKSSIETQLEFFAVALLMAMPSVMIFFTLVVNPKINRWLNIILAAFYIVLLIAVNTEAGWWFYLFLTAIEILISMAIIWYAWKWPTLEKRYPALHPRSHATLCNVMHPFGNAGLLIYKRVLRRID